MSLFSAFTEGWSFRTNTPSFEPGAEITAFVTGRTSDGYVARIGDTILQLDDPDADARGEAASGSQRGTESESGADATGDGDRSPDDASADLVDSRVRLRVEEFSENDHTGRATVLERLGEGSF